MGCPQHDYKSSLTSAAERIVFFNDRDVVVVKR